MRNPAGGRSRSERIGRGLLPHAASFELFSRSARAGVVPSHLFSNVTEGLALLLGGRLRAGDGGVLGLPDPPAAPDRDGGELGLGRLVDRLRPFELPARAEVIEEFGVEM